MTYFRGFVLLVIILTLGACGGSFEGRTPRAPSYITTQSGVTIVGLRGYCIDKKSLSVSDIGEHIVLGNCASLARDVSLHEPAKKALLLASVSRPTRLGIGMGVNDLDRFFRSGEGRKILARGAGNSIVVRDSFLKNGLYILVIDESSPPNGFQTRYWRGFMDVKGTMVALVIHGFKTSALSEKEGLRILEGFAQAIRNANDDGGGRPTEFAKVDRREPRSNRGTVSPIFTIGIFRQIFK